jgi:predicted small secreted protein
VALPGLNSSKRSENRKIEKCRSKRGGSTIGAPRATASRTKNFGDIIMHKIIGLTIAAAALLLAGCNTISGVGRDVSSVGSTVSKTADKHK